MQVIAWQRALADHPDGAFAKYIVRGLTDGFRVGFQYEECIIREHPANMKVADPQVVTDYLRAEREANRVIVMSLEEATELGVHSSPIGIIPKKNKPNKWRLIVDLSAPAGGSVNDGINKELCSMSYMSVDAIAEKVVAWGKSTLLAKMDIKQAYRMVPVHPQDRRLLGMRWEGSMYVDKVLPFGLRSAPLIFSAVADALQWILRQKGVSFVEHYLDDFITLGKPGTDECASNQELILETCRATGTPIEPGKTEGPTTRLVFLGIEIDSEAMEMRLPDEKLSRLKESLAQWRGKKVCRKREILSIIGSLSHACKVVKPGRSFLRRLIDLSKAVKDLNHFVRLNREARSDLEWWFQFAEAWNGTSLMYESNRNRCEVTLVSDASGTWGCGAFCRERWFQLRWPPALQESHITIKEMLPIVLAAAVWGKEWIGKSVMALCDNAAVVAIVNSGSSRDQEVMHLMRCLTFLKAKFQFSLFSSHIRGVDNDLADALSRDNKAYFLSHFPQAQQSPTILPASLLELTVIRKPDWISALWTDLWSDIFRQD